MELTVDQAAFARALRAAGRAIGARSYLPILQTVLLEATPGRVTLTATDLELAAVTGVAADVTAPGRVAAPARLLADWVAGLPTEPVRLTVEPGKGRLRARCGRSTATLAAQDADDFPVVAPVEDARVLALDGRRLGRALARVLPAASRDEGRPALTAVRFTMGPDGLRLAAVDGFRLAQAALPEIVGEETWQLLVPQRAAAEFARVAGEGGTARLAPTADGRGAWLTVGETAIFARLVEAPFPLIDGLVPRAWRTRVTVGTDDLRRALKLAASFGGGEQRPAVLDAAPGGLVLRSPDDGAGEGETALGAAVEGEPSRVAVNLRLLADLLATADAPTLALAWESPAHPIVVRQVGAGETPAADLWLVMPLHLVSINQAPAKATASNHTVPRAA